VTNDTLRDALIDWLQSQGVAPEDAVPALIEVAAAGIAWMARMIGDETHGVNIGNQMLTEAIGQAAAKFAAARH
jgi:hypothetical protein